MAYKEVTTTFIRLSERPTCEEVVSAMPMIERFVVLMYDRASSIQNLNLARKALFTQKCLEQCPELPSPSEWGWKRSESQLWEPLWTTLPEASKACQELLKCGCNPEKGCRGHCKCVKAELDCTALCKCGGECERN
ncbi:hypothetical protein ACROYT_G015925 [Oculina patagonica]